MLQPGVYDVPAGMIATVVTSLEMFVPAEPRPDATVLPFRLEQLHPNPAEYRALYKMVGDEWLWISRLHLNDDDLQSIIGSAKVEIYKISGAPEEVGMLELDFREPRQCELKFFGISKALQGGQAGRWLMNRAVERAWSKPIRRFWVHTCTLDHPNAVQFYMRSGFTPFRRSVEILEDPRLRGLARMDASCHVPVLVSHQ